MRQKYLGIHYIFLPLLNFIAEFHKILAKYLTKYLKQMFQIIKLFTQVTYILYQTFSTTLRSKTYYLKTMLSVIAWISRFKNCVTLHEWNQEMCHQQYTRKDPNRNDADFNPFILAWLRYVFECRIPRWFFRNTFKI